jgi:hypothetical protein
MNLLSNTTFAFKKKSTILFKFYFLFLSLTMITDIHSQTPGTWNGNSAPSNPQIGPTLSSTSSDNNSVGIGTNNPKAWLEINYCPDQNKGLLIMKNNSCNPFPGFSFNNGVDIFSPNILHQIVATNPSWQENSTLIDLTYYPTLTIPQNGIIGTTVGGPTISLSSTPQPLLTAKTYDPINPALDATRFLVTPSGNTGINMPSPRVSLDVRSGNLKNLPTAIFGINSSNTTSSYTKHMHFVSNLSNSGYNNISKDQDQGLFFTDGMGINGSNLNANSGFVIAPWGDNGQGGLRMEANGNTELRGNLRATKVVVNAQWWPDFVFHCNYNLMPLSDVAKFINTKHHLPGMPSQDSVMSNGQDVGELQKLQQQKIEELTLYTIQQDEQLKAQDARLKELEAKLNALINK